MWELHQRGAADISALVYQDASFKYLSSTDVSPVQFLGHVLDIEHELISKLERAVPTWLNISDLDSDFMSAVKDETHAAQELPSVLTSTIAITTPASKETAV